jgi:hypothetical protein
MAERVSAIHAFFFIHPEEADHRASPRQNRASRGTRQPGVDGQ